MNVLTDSEKKISDHLANKAMMKMLLNKLLQIIMGNDIKFPKFYKKGVGFHF